MPELSACCGMSPKKAKQKATRLIAPASTPVSSVLNYRRDAITSLKLVPCGPKEMGYMLMDFARSLAVRPAGIR